MPSLRAMHGLALALLVLTLSGCASTRNGTDGIDGAAGGGPTGPGASDEPAADPAADAGLEWTWTAGGPALPFGLAEAAFASPGQGGILVGGFVAPLGGSATVLRVPADADGGDVAVELPPYPLPIHHGIAAVLDGIPYVFGGYVGGTPNPAALVGASSSGWPLTAASFHLEGDAWIRIADLPEPRAAGGAAVVDGAIYIIGGTGNAGHPATVLRYDMATDSYDEVADLPVPRDHLNVVEHAGLVYAIAGRDIAAAAVDDLASFEVYDPAADTWTVLPDCPLGRGGQAAAVLHGRIVVAGGERIEGEFTVYDEVHAYDIAADRWVTLPPMPEARHGGAFAVVADALAYLGGATLAGELASSSLLLSAQPATTA